MISIYRGGLSISERLQGLAEGHRYSRQQAWRSAQACPQGVDCLNLNPFSASSYLGAFLNIPGPQFPYLYSGNNSLYYVNPSKENMQVFIYRTVSGT